MIRPVRQTITWALAATLSIGGNLCAQAPAETTTPAADPSEATASTKPTADSAAQTEDLPFAKDVDRACTHRRYGLRLAASRAVAKAGDAAMPALRAFAAKHGPDAIPMAVVDVIATSGSGGEATLELLESWASMRDFFWRSHALKGLAERRRPQHRELFEAALTDPSWLVRLQGARGLHLLGKALPSVHGMLEDKDPRLAPELAAHLLNYGDETGVTVLLGTLGDERVLLDDPWGRRRANTGFRALSAWIGNDFGYVPAATMAENAEAMAKAIELSTARGAPVSLPDIEAARTRRATSPDDDAIAGGIDLRSCRNGDLFLRWDAKGTIFIGLDGVESTELAGPLWSELLERAPETLSNEEAQGTKGVVICDSIRVVGTQPAVQLRAAPHALPVPTADWLKLLAQALEKADGGDPDRAARSRTLLDRLDQFLQPR